MAFLRGKKIVMVFPAYAGMFLTSRPLFCRNLGFPRIRGDVPEGHLQHQWCC